MTETAQVVPIVEAKVAEPTTLEALEERLGVQAALLEGVLTDLRQPEEEGSQLDARTVALVAPKTTLRVRSQATYETACNTLRMVKELANEVKAIFKPLRDKSNEAHKLAKVHEDFYLKRLAAAERELKTKIGTYERDQKRKWDERQAELEAKAEAVAAETGDAPEMVMARPTLEKVSGVSSSKVWRCQVDDEAALRKAVYAGTVPEDVLVLDPAALNRYAKAMKESLPFPGCKAVWEASGRVVVK